MSSPQTMQVSPPSPAQGKCKVKRKWDRKLETQRYCKLTCKDTATVVSETSGIYVIPGTQVLDVDFMAPQVCVGTAAARQTE